jgi:hypothetical protein
MGLPEGNDNVFTISLSDAVLTDQTRMASTTQLCAAIS